MVGNNSDTMLHFETPLATIQGLWILNMAQKTTTVWWRGPQTVGVTPRSSSEVEIGRSRTDGVCSLHCFLLFLIVFFFLFIFIFLFLPPNTSTPNTFALNQTPAPNPDPETQKPQDPAFRPSTDLHVEYRRQQLDSTLPSFHTKTWIGCFSHSSTQSDLARHNCPCPLMIHGHCLAPHLEPR